MDPITNPYSPGAGSPPPELAGRDAIRRTVNIALERIRLGNPAKSVLMVGLRGVGKTVLLDRMRMDAMTAGFETVRLEAPEGRSLPAMLAPQLRAALLRLSRIESAKDKATRALRALAGFAKHLKVSYADIEVNFDYEPEPGLADNGDLEGDLTVLFEQIGIAAKEAGTALVLFIDELQYVKEGQLGALITALHRCAQLQLPLTLVGAGLPQLRALAGEAKSYAERLFDYPPIGALDDIAASDAIEKPAEARNAAFDSAAVAEIVRQTHGYPYFLQEWGKHSWDAAAESPITLRDVAEATIQAITALDESFFRVRLDRVTPAEKQYLRAMAELGPGPHRSGDIAMELGKQTSTLGPVRSKLIAKGMIWSPSFGDTAFTVPLFDEYMRRTLPDTDWKTEV